MPKGYYKERRRVFVTNNSLDASSVVTVTGSTATTSVTPGTAATNLGKAEDAAHTSGDVGVMALAVRNDSGTSLAGTDLDYAPLSTDSNGNLRANLTASGQVLTSNGSTTPLTGGATFTGSWVDVSGYPSVVLAAYADVAGTLYAEFSADGSTTHSSLSYSVAAATNEVHKLTVTRRYFRSRYTNGSAAQASFSLQCLAGHQEHLTSSFNTSIQSDADAVTVRTLDPVLNLARSVYANITHVNKFGFNSDVDTATDPQDLWLNGGIWVPPTQARAMVITSSSTNDTSGGTGAQTILISGLDANWDQASETITMNGTSNVTSVGTYQRINRMRVLTAGSVGTNDGTITCTAQTDATIQATIGLHAVAGGYGQTLLGIFTIPAGYTGYMTRWYVDYTQSIAASTSTIGLINRINVDTATPALNIKDVSTLTTGGQSRSERVFNPYISLPAKSDVFIRILEVSSNNSRFSGGFDIILVA